MGYSYILKLSFLWFLGGATQKAILAVDANVLLKHGCGLAMNTSIYTGISRVPGTLSLLHYPPRVDILLSISSES